VITGGVLAKAFEPPTTKDFVWDPWFGPVKILGIEFSFTFIHLLLLIAFLTTVLFFVAAFRRPKVVPGKFQSLAEMGVEFVREQILLQMIGPEGMAFLPFLATLFFFIFFGNILEVVPGVNFPLNSRIAFPAVMAVISWTIYWAVGFRKHGVVGYLKMVAFPPGAPAPMYILLAPIELLQVVVIRPLTLSVRLFANMVAGHFLLAVFFLGSIVLFSGPPYVLGTVSFAMGVVLVGFEIFVSGLQAFIFTVLTASYIGAALAEEH